MPLSFCQTSRSLHVCVVLCSSALRFALSGQYLNTSAIAETNPLAAVVKKGAEMSYNRLSGMFREEAVQRSLELSAAERASAGLQTGSSNDGFWSRLQSRVRSAVPLARASTSPLGPIAGPLALAAARAAKSRYDAPPPGVLARESSRQQPSYFSRALGAMRDSATAPARAMSRYFWPSSSRSQQPSSRPRPSSSSSSTSQQPSRPRPSQSSRRRASYSSSSSSSSSQQRY